MRSSTTRALVVATVALLATGCHGPTATFSPVPSPHPDAVVMVRASGEAVASKKLTADISDHVVTADCTGTGHLTFKATLGDADITNTITCPSVMHAPAVTVSAGQTVRLEITNVDGDAEGFVELAPNDD